MIRLLRDFVRYPRDQEKDTNRFHQLMQMLFKDYPAFFRRKPSWKRLIVFPILLFHYLFKK